MCKEAVPRVWNVIECCIEWTAVLARNNKMTCIKVFNMLDDYWLLSMSLLGTVCLVMQLQLDTLPPVHYTVFLLLAAILIHKSCGYVVCDIISTLPATSIVNHQNETYMKASTSICLVSILIIFICGLQERWLLKYACIPMRCNHHLIHWIMYIKINLSWMKIGRIIDELKLLQRPWNIHEMSYYVKLLWKLTCLY